LPNLPKYSNLIAAITTIASCAIALGFTFQLLPLLMEHHHVPARIIGLNTAMGPLGILLVGPILPHIIGRVGPKRLAYCAAAFIMTAPIIFRLTPSLYVWFPLRFLCGIAIGALFAIRKAWILTFAGRGNRGRIMGIYTSVMAISFSFGPFMLPCTGIDDWLPWIIGIRDLGMGTLPLAFIDVSDDLFRNEEGGNFQRVIERAPLLQFAVQSATLFDSVCIYFFSIFRLRSGLTLQTASGVLGAGITGSTLFQFMIGSLSDQWSRVGVVVYSAIITVIMSIPLIFVVNSWLIWSVIIILFAFAAYVVALATMGDTFKGGDLIAGSAAFSAMWGVGGLIGPPIVGAAIDRFGVDTMPVALASFYMILLLALTLSGDHLIGEVQLG
jgi:MFS family permease